MSLFNYISFLIRKFPIKGGLAGAMGCLFLASMISCNMITEDLDPCAPPPKNYTVVNFVYDYNMWDEDLFFDHVGSVKLYIFDEKGIYIDDEEKHKEFFAPGEDFTMTFSDERLVPGRTYNLVAVAQGNTIGYDGSDEYQWFKVVNEMKRGISSIEEYVLRLDRDPDNDGFSEVGVINYKDQYGQTQQMIDTLWTTKPDEVQTVKINKLENYTPTVEQQPDNITEVTIPMMRITNAVKVNVLGPIIDKNTDKDDYHVVIYFPNGNGYVDFCGDISQSTHPLYYQSLVKHVSPYTSKKEVRTRDGSESTDDRNTTYALQADFGVSRLMAGDESSLQLYSKDDKTTPLVEIPFTDYLTKYLNDTDYDDQEFLDREYDFEVDMSVNKDGSLEYLQFTCNILSWARRVYFYDIQ